jgi:ubiquinone/menaquinone biosynthesis C-methylase UbiE
MGLDVHGIDVAGEMVRQARQRMAGHPLEKRCHFEVGDIERLRYASGTFNAVLCMGVLEYLPRYSRALNEIWRVLAPGGVVVITLPNRASTYHVARSGYDVLRALNRQLRRRGAPKRVPANRCVPWKFDRELAEAGLHKVESRACNFIFFPLQELLPRASESLNQALMPLAGSAVAPLLGAQYIVKAEKSAWRSASSA